VIAVVNHLVPTTIRGIRQFIGLVSYYQKFIKEFAKIATPINLLMRKNVLYEWKEEQQKVFELLKQKLIEAPILTHLNFDKLFLIYTDASGIGLSAILSQKNDQN